jgi:hypothetical protein
MKNTVKYIIGIILALSVGLVVGYICPRGRWKANDSQADTTTVIHYDTIRTIPDFISSKQVGVSIYPIKQVPALLTISDTVKTPYFIHDTLIIPIEQKYYTTDAYKAWVSGYNPRLDSIVVYNTHTLSTIKENTARNQLYLSAQLNYIHPFPAMTIGVQAGYNRDRWGLSVGGGAVITPTGPKWYGMVGMKYDLLIKKW